MKLENSAKRSKILPIIFGIAAIPAAIGLTSLVLNLQPKEPEIQEQIEERKFREDYQIALENYSREAHKSGQNVKISELTFASNSDLFAFVKAYSQDYLSK